MQCESKSPMGLHGDGGLQSPLLQKDLGFASPSAIQDFTWAAESTEKLLGASVPQCPGQESPLLLLQGWPGRDHPANCGKGLHKNPSRKFTELSQLLWAWPCLSCKHTSTMRMPLVPKRGYVPGISMDESQAQRKWELPGSGQDFSSHAPLQGNDAQTNLSRQWGTWGMQPQELRSLLALTSPATCSLSKAMHVPKGCRAKAFCVSHLAA